MAHAQYDEDASGEAARAMALHCPSAEAGSAESQYHLGWMYLSGRGVRRDAVKAGRWLADAAANGDPQAAAVMERFRIGSDGLAARCALRKPPPGPAAWRAVAAPAEVARLVSDLAPLHGLDPRLVLAVIQVESAFRADAVSPRNAQGLMQVIPATAERFGIDDPLDVRGNLTAGMKYLRWLLSYFRGDVSLSLAAYNAGEKRVFDYGGIPPFPETRAYVLRIRTYYPALRHPFDPQVAAGSGRPWPAICSGDDVTEPPVRCPTAD
ncbi:lytic transglycosylase domain-containing protein [Magnetospirillum moscoviense]|uniref:Transglycosylase SLT domain-containing protein n=1 Tax=Magnetospirillum moscoviense TaxID=1437059 RepID=A0A178MS51_9PROT|nr:transglycosylase SLT domain-containing protein [Magnetospirillum moscoviense]MBF0324527.1 transglycosylase SLT domain-containing protein [Alphaproteobacteria bacterium]OAN51550.1 hypothetical protein A6A05_01425 [Magnetospirillum moscoviense]